MRETLGLVLNWMWLYTHVIPKSRSGGTKSQKFKVILQYTKQLELPCLRKGEKNREKGKERRREGRKEGGFLCEE